MSDMLTNKITGVKLGIGKLPSRNQECFYFVDGSKLIPAAYVRSSELEEVKRLWDAVLEGIPLKREEQCQK